MSIFDSFGRRSWWVSNLAYTYTNCNIISPTLLTGYITFVRFYASASPPPIAIDRGIMFSGCRSVKESVQVSVM